MKTNLILSPSNNKIAGIHYTTEHTGKMAGLASLSTDINSNPLCIARQKMGYSVCSHCFAARMYDDNKGRYRKVNQAFKRNTEILTSRILEDNEIPFIPFALFRFEATADLNNVTQALNYIKIARKNPQTKFALWSKNPGFAIKAFRIAGKPKNLQFVLSSLELNKPAKGAENLPFIDKVFTVYDSKDKAKINCGANSCFMCKRCYKSSKGIEYVNELIK